jgi:hypothetical protein
MVEIHEVKGSIFNGGYAFNQNLYLINYEQKKSILNIQDLGLSAASRYYELFIENFYF